MDANGISRSIINLAPAASTSRTPEEDFRMGSSTTLGTVSFPRNSTIALTAFAEPSIPILTAAISRSRVNSPSVSVTVSGSTVCTLLTPTVDWTVKAVMQATP